MLREATPSANDAARLDAIEAAFPDTSRRREADHDKPMPPKVAGAAALRSQRVPGSDMLAAAWRGLPLAVQDQLGSTALALVFHEWVASDSDYAPAHRWFTDAAVGRAVMQADEGLAGLKRIAEAALPALFGAGGSAPDWSRLGRVNPVTPFTLALAHICEVERTRPEGLRVHDAREWAAYHGLLSAPLQTRGDLVALYEYVRPTLDAPSECLLGRAFEALAMALGIDPAAANSEPRERGTLAAESSPVRLGIRLHQQAWAALEARAAFLKAAGWTEQEEVLPLEDEAEATALLDLFLVSCRDLADARALADHLDWYGVVLPRHPVRPELPEAVAAEVAVRRADLALILGEPVTEVPGGGLTAAIEVHRDAWTAYLACPARDIDHDAWLVLWDAAIAAAEVVLRTPCASREDAEALVRHVGWYDGELKAAGEGRADGLTCGAKQLTARAGDLLLALGAGAGRLVA